MVLSSGVIAPDFRILDDTGAEVSLSDFKGKKVVLYFYPKDDTPGCTKEACGFQADMDGYKEKGIVVLGVSPDSVKSHVKFKTKYNLDYPLLADEDHAVAEIYGVWAEKKMFGKPYMGILRTTFLIDEEGMIIKVFENVSPASHSQEVLAAFPG